MSIFTRQQFGGSSKKLVRPSGFEFHQGYKSLVVFTLLQFRFEIIESRQIFLREVNSAAHQIFSHVPDNVCHLQSQTELNGVFPASGIAVTENLNAYETDRAGNAVTINPKFFKSGITG